MDFDDIKFTEWQIDKVRAALGKYRILNASKGNLMSWSRVRDEIIYSDINIDKYSEDDAELVFKSEALRRFFVRTSVLELEKLKDVTRFLLGEEIISLDDMDENETGLKQMLAVHEYLATKTDRAKSFLIGIEGTYIAQREFDGPGVSRWETFTLRIMPDPSKEFVRVEEVYESSSEDLSACKTIKERNAYTNLRVVQLGYGFSIASDIFLHVFLHGAEPGACISYVQADFAEFNHLAGHSTVANLYLLRHCSMDKVGRKRKALPDGTIHLFNALQFAPPTVPS